MLNINTNMLSLLAQRNLTRNTKRLSPLLIDFHLVCVSIPQGSFSMSTIKRKVEVVGDYAFVFSMGNAIRQMDMLPITKKFNSTK